VEDVGELYPDISYKQRHSRGMTIGTPDKANKASKDKAKDQGDLNKSSEKSQKEKEAAQDTSTEVPKQEPSEVTMNGAAADKATPTEAGVPAGGSERVEEDEKAAEPSKAAETTEAVVQSKEMGDGEDADEAAVNEQELAAHHMPDLIEGVQPMFVKGDDGKDAAAKDKASSVQAPESTTSSMASSDTTAAAPPTVGASAAPSVKESSASAAKEAVGTSSARPSCATQRCLKPSVFNVLYEIMMFLIVMTLPTFCTCDWG